MKIIAHRGFWHGGIKSNSMEALKNALDHGFGFESDVRDYKGRLVIAHNVADSDSLDAELVFKSLHDHGDKYMFAINIKADGLKDMLAQFLIQYEISNYFLFDMSIPQMVEFKEKGMRFFTRQSEIEQMPSMYDDAAGVWIDGFWSYDWITEELLIEHINAGKEICIVSPDLHGREDYKSFWKMLKGYNVDFNRIMMCTDYPDSAREFFYV